MGDENHRKTTIPAANNDGVSLSATTALLKEFNPCRREFEGPDERGCIECDGIWRCQPRALVQARQGDVPEAKGSIASEAHPDPRCHDGDRRANQLAE